MASLPPPPSTGYGIPSHSPVQKKGFPTWAWLLIGGFIVAAITIVIAVWFGVTRFFAPLLNEGVLSAHSYPGIAVMEDGSLWIPVEGSSGYELVRVSGDGEVKFETISMSGQSLVTPQVRGEDLFFQGYRYFSDRVHIYSRPLGGGSPVELLQFNGYTNKFAMSPSAQKVAIVKCSMDMERTCPVVIKDATGGLLFTGPSVAYYDELAWLSENHLLISMTLEGDSHTLLLNLETEQWSRLPANAGGELYFLFYSPSPRNPSVVYAFGYNERDATRQDQIYRFELTNQGVSGQSVSVVPRENLAAGVSNFAISPDGRTAIFATPLSSAWVPGEHRFFRFNLNDQQTELMFSRSDVTPD